jgi:hypothetical protein
MRQQPENLAAAGRVQRMRVLMGGRVEIEREVVRLCAQRHFDPARFEDLTRQLEGPAKAALRVVARGDLLSPVLHED